jgi:hypothetical protein
LCLSDCPPKNPLQYQERERFKDERPSLNRTETR